MNLIERLGGYRMANEVMDSVPKDGRSYTITRDDTGVSFNTADLHDALLEHRRTNNIFEDGDWFVSDFALVPFKIVEHSEKYLKLWNEKNTVTISNNQQYIIDVFKNARHATDEEIAAGHRL